MTQLDWMYVGITVLGIAGLMLVSRYVRPKVDAERVPKWPVFLGYNAFCAVLFVLDSLTSLVLPGFILPVLVVGGNAAIANVIGLPTRPQRRKAAKAVRAPVAPDPSRAKIVPKAQKRRHKRRQ